MEPFVSTLAGELVSASTRLDEARDTGQDVGTIKMIIRSLRQTLATIAQGRSLAEVGALGFVLMTDHTEEPSVRWAGRTVPISTAYLKSLLSGAGVDLRPYQVILLDRAFVKLLIKEGLANQSLKAAVLEKDKAVLRAAHLAADGEALPSLFSLSPSEKGAA